MRRLICYIWTSRNNQPHPSLHPGDSIKLVKPWPHHCQCQSPGFIWNIPNENILTHIQNESKITEYQNLAAKSLSDASEYWATPESIPLLCTLISKLLVLIAELVYDTKSPAKAKEPGISKNIQKAKSSLANLGNGRNLGNHMASKTPLGWHTLLPDQISKK